MDSAKTAVGWLFACVALFLIIVIASIMISNMIANASHQDDVTQIQILNHSDFRSLESMTNQWLEDNQDKYTIVSVDFDYIENGTYMKVYYFCTITYKVK